MTDQDKRTRARVIVRGVVQGVGFRPFVFRQAIRQKLVGWVQNRPDGVWIEAEGSPDEVAGFVKTLSSDGPPRAQVTSVEWLEVPLADDVEFRIIESSPNAGVRPTLPADIAICADCAAEIDGQGERRQGYAFTNCTNCGPRYSIVHALPYDRARTSMSSFPMCDACSSEYDNPLDRRFHAQPIACPACGPRLALVSRSGEPICEEADVLRVAAMRIRRGEVLALKGLGGFQLLVDATNQEAVRALRRRKHREAKPFAVMFPSIRLAKACCTVHREEERILSSAESPILLLTRLPSSTAACCIAEAVAPRNPRLGVMLPYTPLHRLLMRELERPVVCTSGNQSDEPICISNEEAFVRLGEIADVFLIHDRGVVRPVDDSVARLGPFGLELLRRARGYAPLPIALPMRIRPALAVGGHLKSTVCVAVGDQAVVSQHLGDLGSAEGMLLLERTVKDLTSFFGVVPEVVSCDCHPDYGSTRLAERLAREYKARLIRVQHHHAHVAACIAERGLEGEVLGLAWDGAGLGDDHTIWGGEALVCREGQYERFAHLRPFPLVGGDVAAREPRRAALGLLHAAGKPLGSVPFFGEAERAAMVAVLDRGTSTVPTSSIGRLFDGVAALVGIRGTNRFEGEAAMELEFAVGDAMSTESPYPLPLVQSASRFAGDFGPLIDEILSDLRRDAPLAVISARFHAGLAEFAVACAKQAAKQRVILSGGCFQNSVLALATRQCLLRDGFEVIVPSKLPCNDGGLCLGQLLVAGYQTS